MIGSTIFGMLVPEIIKRAIDTVASHGEVRYLFLSAGTIIGASVLRGLCFFGHLYCSDVFSQKASYTIRNNIYDQLQRLSFAYHDNTQTGQLMSRATADVEAVRILFARGVISALHTVILFIGISCFLIIMNWKLALMSLVFIPLIGYRIVIVSLRLRPIMLKAQRSLGFMGNILEENLTGARIVKSFCQQNAENKKFQLETDRLFDNEIKAARMRALNMPFLTFLITVPSATILWYGGLQVINESLTIGELTQFIMYMGMLVVPVRRLGGLTQGIPRAISAGERIFEVLDVRPVVGQKPDAIDLSDVNGEISVNNVSFSYDASGPVLQDISFTARPGELIALVGSLGSGKSTLAHLIPRFYDVTSGSITIDGVDIRDVKLASLRKNIGIVQQDIFLFSDTIRENIAYGVTDADPMAIEEVSKAAYLHDFVISLPDGYETWVGERGITLSGGEKQRLAIARTLLTDPSVLILDDSTSSVDARIEHLIRQALDRLIQGRTTFIITHRLPIIKTADLILVLDKGRMAEQGRHEDLIKRNGLYRQIYNTQLSVTKNS
jgi:ATP-binding cassette subfamily B protein